MASKLTEADIPGASLEGRTPESLKIGELKFWLCCCGVSGLSKLKTKRDYVQRFVLSGSLRSYLCIYNKHNFKFTVTI